MYRRPFRFFIGILLFIPIITGTLESQTIPDSPDRWITDKAGFLSPQTVAALDRELELFEKSTGHQFIIYIDRSTQGYPIEEWAVHAYEAWGVGQKGSDDGLALFIMTEDRKLRIEVGYGLEHIIPDATASRIVDRILLPSIRDGNQDTGVTQAVAQLVSIISGEGDPLAQEPGSGDTPRKISPGGRILMGLLVIFFIFLLITNPRLAIHLLLVIMSNRGGGGGRSGGGGGRSGGGGFSGGGGRSGGGGASGSW